MVVEVPAARHRNLGADVHGLQLLEQQLACVRQVDLVDAVAHAAVLAPSGASQKPALPADKPV